MLRSLARASVPALSRAVAPTVQASRAATARPALLQLRAASSHATPHLPQQQQGADLRSAVEAELSTLRSKIAGMGGGASPDAAWFRPLSRDETAFVNMGQVPSSPGAEVLALLDLDLRPVPTTLGDGDKRKTVTGGVHVPLLAHMGHTEPAVPCYPLRDLFGARAPRVVGHIHDVLGAQVARNSTGKGEAARAELETAARDASLVAVVVPADGAFRDLAMGSALALFRLALHEGNGQEEAVL
ncbi:uncharacterized protein LOC62_03G005089 [Vanrija pseudolonga]|uniref:Uncharacterized protein n=1 Tax=Vanrija pseudolonga TaxID=143232 RepID=A0AAF1BII1_9TREE|nr:hypothetical protein LOC62_03G005089 [Vanrija pseudolonga]